MATEIRTGVSLDPSKVYVGKRVRLDVGNIEDLKKSIAEVGQIHPITVVENGKRLEIVVGYRRLLACKQLKKSVRAEILAPQEAIRVLELELHENVRRKDFDRAELGEGMLRHKRMYEQLHPATKHGGARKKGEQVADGATRARRYTLVAAEAMGMSERSAQQLVSVGREIESNKDAQRKLKTAKTVAERNQVVQEIEREVKRKAKLEALKKQGEAAKQTTIDDIGKPKKPPVRLHYGDCNELLIGSELYDLCLTDPPYDRERASIGHVTRAIVNPTQFPWDKLDVGWVLKAAPTIKLGGQLLIFCPLEAIGAYELVLKAAGLDYRMALTWCKTNPGTAHRATYLHAVEAVVWASKPGGKVYFADWETQAGGAALSWFEGPICGGNERLSHPTQKPLWLIKRLLQRHAAAGAHVLDPFSGVGTTGAACRELGLECTMIERDQEFVKMARARLEALK